MKNLTKARHKNHNGFCQFGTYTACLLLSCTGIALTTPSRVLAQQAATALEEVMVTARKREESLQDVPLSVTAFNDSALKQAGIQTMQELSDFTPGFDFAQAFGRQDFRPAIRGQSTIQGGANAGLFIDGFFIGVGAPTVPYAALERVEVAKGPQSALYGRSTLAGAINYILKRPTENYEGVLEVGIGEDAEYRTELTLSGPLGANAGFMVSFSGYQYDGQYSNRFRGLPDPADATRQRLDAAGDSFVNGAGRSFNVGEEETYSAVALLELRLSDKMKLTGRLLQEESDDGPYAIAIQPQERNNCYVGSAYGRSGYYCGEVDVEDILDDDYDNDLNLDTGYYGLGLEYEATRLSGTLDYDLDWAMLTFNAAWHDYDSQSVQDQSFGPAMPGRGDANVAAGRAGVAQSRAGFISDDKVESEEQQFELRLSSPADERLRWILGAYWYDFESSEESRDSGVGSSAVTTRSVTTIAVPGADNLMYTAGNDENRTNWAVFAALEYDLSEILTLGLEVRYNEEEVEVTDVLFCDDGEPCVATEGQYPSKDFSTTYDDILYRLTLDYRFNDDVLFYGTLATGNKPGDVNTFNQPLLSSQIPVDESTAETYELGVKVNLEEQVQLAAAVYSTEWEDQQLTFTTQGANNAGATSILNNLGETRVRGLELDLRARPADFWDLRLTYAYTHTDIKEATLPATGAFGFVISSSYREAATIFGQGDPGSGSFFAFDPMEPECNVRALHLCPTLDISGRGLPQVSKNQWSLSNTFNGVLANGMDWYLRLDFLHRSKRYAQIYNLAHTGDSNVINLRAGLSLDTLADQFMGGGGLEVALWAKNLTDDQTSPALIRYVENAGASRAIGFTLPRQRSFGIDLTYRF